MHKLPIDIVTNGSVLDVSTALKSGSLSLWEVQGDPPEQDWRDCTWSKVPKELFSDATYDPQTEPLHFVRLVSGFRAPVTDPQHIESWLHPSISSVLKDGVVYRLGYCKEAFRERRTWNGGIIWWKVCTDPNQLVDLAAPTDEPEAIVCRANLPCFKAMVNPPRPPKLKYELEISPTIISLSDLNPMKISVSFRICEPTKYTVMWRKNDPWTYTTALGSNEISSFSFEIFDVSTGETISRTGVHWNMLGASGLSSAAIRRDQLRELYPSQTYSGWSKLDGGERKQESFLKFFRVPDKSELLNRRLAVRLRSVDTYWSEKSIDELFEHEESIRRDHWYIPLTIQSSAKAEFSITL